MASGDRAWDSMENDKNILSSHTGGIQKLFRKHENDIRNTKRELQECQAEVQELRTRLSKMASQRMSANNPCVEDMNDPRRPTALATSWHSLFQCGGYWSAYDAIGRSHAGRDPPQVLYGTTKIVYDTCVKAVEDVRTDVMSCFGSALLDKGNLKFSVRKEIDKESRRCTSILRESLPGGGTGDPCSSFLDFCQKRLVDDITSFETRHRSSFLQFLKSRDPPHGLKKKAQDAIQKDFPLYPRELDEFATELLRICYYMRLQEIPMEVDFDHGAGSAFDPHLFEAESSEGMDLSEATICSVLRPPLLRSKNGSVLDRGEAAVQGHKKQAAPADKPAAPTPAADKTSQEGAMPRTVNQSPQHLLQDRVDTAETSKMSSGNRPPIVPEGEVQQEGVGHKRQLENRSPRLPGQRTEVSRENGMGATEGKMGNTGNADLPAENRVDTSGEGKENMDSEENADEEWKEEEKTVCIPASVMKHYVGESTERGSRQLQRKSPR